MTTRITVEGMSCGHCEQTVEEALQQLGDVTNATADRNAGQVEVEGPIDTTTVINTIEDVGYSANV